MPNNIKVFLVALMMMPILTDYANAQPEDGVRIGAIDLQKSGANYYNYSDPDKVNIEVIVMGGIRNPGKYLIPQGTTLIDLLSLAGTPVNEELYKNIKLIRPELREGQLSAQNVTIYDYESLFNFKNVSNVSKPNPIMLPGDIIVMQIRPDRTFFEYLRDVMVILTPLLAIANLIISIQRLNN